MTFGAGGRDATPKAETPAGARVTIPPCSNDVGRLDDRHRLWSTVELTSREIEQQDFCVTHAAQFERSFLAHLQGVARS